MAAMKDVTEVTAQSLVVILTVESVPLIGVQTRGNLCDGQKIILVDLSLQTRLLQTSGSQLKLESIETTLQKHAAFKRQLW